MSMFLRSHILFLICVVARGAFGQLVLDEFPTDLRLYARTSDERVVQIPISGTVASASNIAGLSAKLLVGAQTIDTDDTVLTYENGTASFSLSLDIPVTRVDHRVELRNSATNELLAAANSVVAGDVYLVNGQSNALAGFSIEQVDVDPFLRGYSNNSNPAFRSWRPIEQVPCGMWMGRAANELSNQYDLPIAIFNFADPGQRLRFFQPGASSQNFETVFSRLREAGVKDQVKGFIWSQGEADGFGTPIKDYRSRLTAFFEHYLDSLPNISEVYLWQMRAFSCSGSSPNVMEAQRRMNEALPYVKMLSTVNVEGLSDNCHFPYTNGRETLGNWLADVLSVEKYGAVKQGYLSPTVDSAIRTGPQEISVFFDLKGADSLVITGAPWADFKAEGIPGRAIGGRVSGNLLNLEFASDIQEAQGVSYYAHLGPAMDYLHTNLGLGTVTFFNESLTPGDRAVGSLPDANLRMQANVSTLRTGEEVQIEIVLANDGSRSLRETEVYLPLPAALRYVAGQFNQIGNPLVFDDQAHIWLVPFVRPGEHVSLTITYEVLDDQEPILFWGEVASTELSEEDSTPSNGTLGQIHEDDEARVVLGDSTLNCSFSAQVISSECIPDSNYTYWRIAFETEGLPNENALTFDLDPVEAIDFESSSDGFIQLSFDTLRARNALPLVISVQQNSDSTCASSFTLEAPDSCRITVVPPDTIDTSSEVVPYFTALSLRPNPVKSGGLLELTLRSSMLNERAVLFDAAGREVYSTRLEPQQRSIQLSALPAGMYMLHVGRARGKLLIHE